MAVRLEVQQGHEPDNGAGHGQQNAFHVDASEGE
jgi:hypothetical protein